MNITSLSVVLVGLGLFFMAASIMASILINRMVPVSLQNKWLFITSLMIFFLIGYSAFIIIEIKQIPFPLEMLTGIIFFWGAVFVYVVVSITKTTIHAINTSQQEVISSHDKLLQAKENIRIEKEKLDLLTKSIGAGLIEISSDYKIRWMNKIAIDSFGAKEGKSCFSSLTSNECICEGCAAKKVFGTGVSSAAHEHEGIDKHGEVVWSSIVATPLSKKDDKVISVLEVFVPITDKKIVEKEREKLIVELREALDRVQTLSGLLPICSSCKRIRDDQGYWKKLESYISEHSDADFSHGLCPKCAKILYPKYFSEETSPTKEKPKNK